MVNQIPTEQRFRGGAALQLTDEVRYCPRLLIKFEIIFPFCQIYKILAGNIIIDDGARRIKVSSPGREMCFSVLGGEAL